ncbi:MAG TPA: hypothetical protein DCQ04_13595 [Actinobacteria bacterium]|nr:hypothetical protein [Actinomycetota bacterium]
MDTTYPQMYFGQVPPASSAVVFVHMFDIGRGGAVKVGDVSGLGNGAVGGAVSSETKEPSALGDVHARLTQIEGLVDSLSGAEASALLADVTAIAAEVDCLRLLLVSRIESSHIWQAAPNGTANSWLRANHGLDHRGAESDLRAARALLAHQQLRAALESGQISRAHVDVIASVGEANETRRMHLDAFMEVFINIARNSPASVLRTVMRAWADQIDPLTTARDEFHAHRRRFLHVNQLADGVSIEGFFDHEQGAKVIAALNGALSKAWQSDPAAPAGDRRGETECEPATVSTAQQRADAFIAGIIDPALCGGQLPSSGGSRPSVSVVVPLSRLEQPCGTAAVPQWLLADIARNSAGDSESDVIGGQSLVDGTAQLGVSNGPGQQLISDVAAQRMTCDCEIHRIVIDPAGLPIDVGRTMRTFPPHLRKALNLRDKGCVFPGCGKPPGWAQAHHILHWAQGGRTSLENAALLCSKHHHQVHAEDHTVEIGPDGRARVLVRHVLMRQ